MASEQKTVGVGRAIWQQIRLVMRLMKDKRVSIFLKALPVAVVGYVLMPFDLSPDMIPVFGQLDDVGIFFVGMKMFTDMVPAAVLQEHLAAIRAADGYETLGDAVDGDAPLVIDGEVIKEKSPEDIE